ncbi:VOC family protein [Kibdelosporangium lantanae]|uniref:VOC family protein n=1 Tax=Kibdelosporangium lantanae TaxID=1497396 RepID=A0ABW3M6F2_9PSEU
MDTAVSLDDKYTAGTGWALMSGVQALVRMMLEQRRLDDSRGLDTRIFVSGYPGSPLGGLATTDDAAKNHAIFFVIVDDVAKALEKAENLGGKALTPATTTPDGLTFAHVQDPAGNEFGIFTPPAA